jgi:hypothetical protein
MALTSQQRAVRCQAAITVYPDDDTYTNLVDFLADAIHWCKVNGHSFTDALETAVMHFDAEIRGDDILDDLNHESTQERNHTMPESEIDQNEMSPAELRSAADEALEAFWQVIVKRYPQAKTGDLSPLTTVRLDTAAEAAIAEWVWANVPTTNND